MIQYYLLQFVKFLGFPWRQRHK